MSTTWVYAFEDVAAAEQAVGGKWDEVRGLLGGKGANLAEMVRLGLPVPHGFTLTTKACNAYHEAGARFPDGLWDQTLFALRAVEKKTGKKFGDPANPLLVSCRSGAKFSMPGMMDTVLNIGLNDRTAAGMIELVKNPRFVWDSYRRLVQMFGTVVLEVRDEPFKKVIEEFKQRRGVEDESRLGAEDWQAITRRFQELVHRETGRSFPTDPFEQLRLACEAVFRSWNGKRAIDYRNATGIPHHLGTGVNIVAMVFGNMGSDSATGVCTTRNVSTGELGIEGDYLMNAQGEDVVAGTHPTLPIRRMSEDLPGCWRELEAICTKLERHNNEVQDIEFTVERGKLWMLQTRDAKRSPPAAVKIAFDLVTEGRIDRATAVKRVKPDQVDFFFHPQISPEARKAASARGGLLGKGLNVSPGAAVGVVAFDADLAERWGKAEKKAVIMVRPETTPDDVHGMLAAQGILTSRGGTASHAALVARQFGKPAVVGLAALQIDLEGRSMRIAGRTIKEGQPISLDGSTGEVFEGALETFLPDPSDRYLLEILAWADSFRRLQVWANADYPADAERARRFGAQGIGLCRTEHMFFQTERLPHVQKMILATTKEERQAELDALLPYQRDDFAGLFRAMDGLPVIIRLIDPPLHEFLPKHDELLVQVTELRLTGRDPRGLAEREKTLAAVERMREANPMLGLRGVRLGIHMPEVTRMQVRAIMEAACQVAREGKTVLPKVMIPLTSHWKELEHQRQELEQVARQVTAEQQLTVAYKFGTMIEIPRAALTADQIARHAEFFSYGTNDLTQTTYGISRDDAEVGFLGEYLAKGILAENPFVSIDPDGVGKLIQMGVELGRKTRPDLEVGICGEHGGDPASIHFCHRSGLNYVSCSPFRVPIARLAAAHAALADKQ